MEKAAANNSTRSPSEDLPLPLAEQTRFTLERRIGKGNTGEIHEGQLHQADGTSRRVAVKVLADNPNDEPGRLRWFTEQFGQVQAPHLLLPIEFIPSSAGRVLIYEFLEGLSLVEVQRRLKRLGRPMPTPLSLELLAQALQGLEALHGFSPPQLHRSLKPSNFFIQPDGTVMLLDAGVLSPLAQPSTRTKGLAVVNVLPYLAPEQLAEPSRPVPATDLYALAVVVYELLAGRPLFDGSAARRELEIKVGFGVQDKVRALEAVLPGSAGLLSRALAIGVGERYASASEMLLDVRKLQPESQQAELEALMIELMAMPERPTVVPGLRSGETTTRVTGLASDGLGSGAQAVFNTPTVRREVEPIPAHMLVEQVQRKERHWKVGVALASLVVAFAALWWVDASRNPASVRGVSERALQQAEIPPPQPRPTGPDADDKPVTDNSRH